MLVMKFGGASIDTAKRFAHIAQLVSEKTKEYGRVVVVISAMARMTDSLLQLAHEVNPNPPHRELDMLVTVGERVSISLLAMALAKEDKEAVSFTGSQSGIVTCENHADARIVDVRPKRVLEALEQGKIAIVAGCQGVSVSGGITFLGRNGSDTSAVAIAAAIQAPRVEFYKDVAGFYDRDPKRHADAKLLAKLCFEEALLYSFQGAKILHPRCIELAKRNGISLAIYSFQDPRRPGTVIEAKRKEEGHIAQYEVMACLHT